MTRRKTTRENTGLSAAKRELLVSLLEQEGIEVKQSISSEDTPKSPPLSFSQQRLWFLHQMDPESHVYNLSSAVRLQGPLDVAALERSLSEIVRRHEILRTTFETIDDQPLQIINGPLPHRLPIIDISDLPAGQREASSVALASSDAQLPFDLSRGPLLRTSLVRLEAEDHIILITMHHIISDLWSMGILVQELADMYNAFCNNKPSSLPELPIQYGDFAHWQRNWLQGDVLESQLSYWRKKLGGTLPLLNLPADRPRPPAQSFRGSGRATLVPKSLTNRLETLSQQEGATLFMTLLAAFKVLLFRLTGQQDLLVGTPIANRSRIETEPLIGFFINTLVLRTDLSSGPRFRELLGRVRYTTLGAFAHQDLPFDLLVMDLQPERDLSHSPLFQVAFSLQKMPETSFSVTGLTLSPVPSNTGSTKFDLIMMFTEIDDGLIAELVYSTDLFDAATIDRWLEHILVLLEAIADDPDLSIDALPLMTQSERDRILREWNRTEAECAEADTILDLFERQAACSPQAIALISDNEELTYIQLNERANRLAHYLLGLGVSAETIVGICLDRSPEMIVGLLAVMKAGGAYLPLDPSYPRHRLSFMIEDAKPRFILTQSKMVNLIPTGNARLLSLDTDWPVIAEQTTRPPSTDLVPDNLAYVIYTSGSTGRPKGVAVTHRGLRNLAEAQFETFAIEREDRILQFASLSFDASIFEIVMSLGAGATLCMAEAGKVLIGAELEEELREKKITVVTIPPSALATMETEGVEELKKIVVAGEACGKEIVKKWGRGRRMYDAYGPTEATVWTTVSLCDADGQKPTIGRPIRNSRVYLLDRLMNPVPVGVAAELLIGGVGLARGYLGRPDLTAERFIPDPFGDEIGGRLYRTGDLARYLPDGNIDFLGRIDDQVKVRGFRIELGEIEYVLAEHPAVQDCVAVAREDGEGNKTIAAFVIPVDKALASVESLRGYLKQQLPDYLVPSTITMLDSFPTTPGGKVDRHALVAASQGRENVKEGFSPPRTRVEVILAEIWSEVLGTGPVGRHDSFFDLGGHSLMAVQVGSRVRKTLQVDLPVRLIFENPVLSDLAERIQAKHSVYRETISPSITPVSRDGAIPLSFAQQRLWFLHQLDHESVAYNMPVAVRLRGALNERAVEKSIAEIIRRHEVLRTTFTSAGGQVVQVPRAFDGYYLPEQDLWSLDEASREIEAARIAREESRRPFDLETGPLFRSRLISLAETDHILLLTMHHIVSDGWSSAILVRELTSLYEAFSAGQRSPLPGLPVQYADFAVWQRRWLQGEALEAQVDYWSRKLQGLPVLSLPIDRPRPKARTTEGARQTRILPGSLCARLNDLSSSENVTIFMLLLAAFKSLLHYYTRQTDIVVGTDVAGRNSEETERLIGFFVNQIVLRCDLSGDPSFRQLVARVREMALEAYAYQELPFDKLVEEINPERDMSMTPLFQVKFVHQNVPLPTLQQSDLSLEIIGSEGTPAKFDLLLEVIESGDRLTCVLDYSTQLFEAETISRMLQHYDSLLTMIAERPDARLQEIVEVLARADLEHTAAKEEALGQATVQSLRSARRKPLSLSQP